MTDTATANDLEYVDLAGNPISVGDYVAYAALWNRSSVLKYGKVVELDERLVGPATFPNADGDRRTPTLKVITVDQQVSYDRDWMPTIEWRVQNGGKVVTLGYLDRVLVVADHQIPWEARREIARY